MGGKSYKGKGGRAGRQPRGQGAGDEERWAPNYLQAVDSKWHFGKASLRPYASETGSPFYGKGKSDAEHLALHNLVDRLNCGTSEACNRMGVALSEAGGTVEMMAAFVDKYLQDPRKTLQQVGLEQLAEQMSAENAQGLRDAACVLNKHSERTDKPTMSLHEAVNVWVEYFGNDCKEKAKHWQRLARSSATQFVFAMEMLQWLALGKDPQAWADRVKERRDLQPEEVQKWIRGPTSVDRLTEALAASYTAQIARKAKRGGGLSSEASSSEKPKAKKDKKKRKRSSSSPPAKAPAKKKKSESSESDSSAKKKRKSKKDNKKKDKKESSKKKESSAASSSKSASVKPAKSVKKDKKRQAAEQKAKEAEAAARQEAKTAAFTVWSQDAVEDLLGQVSEAKGGMGLMTGRRKKEDLLKVARLVPLNILPFFAEVEQALKAIVEADDEWISNSHGKPLMCMLEDLAQEVAAFQKEQADTAEASEKK